MSTDANTRIWDDTFPLLRLEGSGARSFLHGQTSAELQQAAEGPLIRSCWLTATGRVQALLEIRLDGSGADVLVLAGDAGALAAGFDRVIFPADKVRLGATVQRRRLQRLTLVSDANGWNDAVHWLEADQEAPAWGTLPAATAAELETWRLEQGLPFGPGELNGETNPLELGLVDWLSLSKGCYLGQETVAKLAARGGCKQQLRRWQRLAPLPEQVIETGTQLLHGEERAGVITSVLHHNGSWTGLALVRRAALTATNLQLAGSGAVVQLSVPTGFREPPELS